MNVISFSGTDAESRRPTMPRGFGVSGRRLWRTITAKYGLRSDEIEALTAACRTLDELTTLEAALVGAPATVTGSIGQQRVNPLFAEVRAHRLTLARLLAAVGLDEADGGVSASSRSTAGRRLAAKRWSGRGA